MRFVSDFSVVSQNLASECIDIRVDWDLIWSFSIFKENFSPSQIQADQSRNDYLKAMIIYNTTPQSQSLSNSKTYLNVMKTQNVK